jgi:uncharacterized lipoprotein YehR (DUF1307 family)
MNDKDRDIMNSIRVMVLAIYVIVMLVGCETCNKQDEIKQQLNNIEYKLNK